MTKENKKQQENFFDIHDHHESIEELELEMSKVVAAMQDALDVCMKSGLPYDIQFGLVQGAVNSYFDVLSRAIHTSAKAGMVLDLIREAINERPQPGRNNDR